jgi:hypothetical protein
MCLQPRFFSIVALHLWQTCAPELALQASNKAAGCMEEQESLKSSQLKAEWSTVPLDQIREHNWQEEIEQWGHRIQRGSVSSAEDRLADSNVGLIELEI